MTKPEGIKFILRGVSAALIGIVVGLLANKVAHVFAQRNGLLLSDFFYLLVFYLAMIGAFTLTSKSWRKDLKKLGSTDKPTDSGPTGS